MEGPQGAPIPYIVGIGVGIGYTLEYMDEGLLSFSTHFLALALEKLKALSTTSADADADADADANSHFWPLSWRDPKGLLCPISQCPYSTIKCLFTRTISMTLYCNLYWRRILSTQNIACNITSHPRIAHGQRYPLPCLECLGEESR